MTAWRQASYHTMMSHALLGPKLAFVLFLLGGASSCRRAPPRHEQAPSQTPTRAADAASLETKNGSPNAVSTLEVRDAAPGDAGLTVHCKALRKHALTPLGSVQGSVIDLQARDGSLFVLAFEQGLRRATLMKLSRDGSFRVKVAHHDGPSEPKSFIMTNDAAYFTRKAHVIRIDLATGDAKEVIHDFTESITVSGAFVYGVSCGPNSTADTLVRVSLTTGDREAIAELPHVPVNKRASGSPPCDYHFLSVDNSTIFISDWAGRRIVSVSMLEKAMREVARTDSYPTRIILEPDTLVYQARDGLHRVSRTGGTVEPLAELANTPDATYVDDGREFWINQEEAYTESTWVYRLAHAGGKPHRVLQFKGYKDCSYPCQILAGVAVDDECLYIAHREATTDSLFAWPKN